jgi:hypothetical protein
MKPNTREQLARFLDQVRSSYPNGIPREVIRAVAEEEAADVPRFHVFVVGDEGSRDEGSLRDGAQELLNGITSKGLKIGPSEYQLSYVSDAEVEAKAASSASPHVIVFGASRSSGWVERPQHPAILFSPSLDALLSETALKKALWRDLQTLLP